MCTNVERSSDQTILLYKSVVIKAFHVQMESRLNGEHCSSANRSNFQVHLKNDFNFIAFQFD